MYYTFKLLMTEKMSNHNQQITFRVHRQEGLQWVEFFAGKAEATRMMRYGGLRSAKLDITYMEAEPGRQNPMDLTTDSGMAFLVSNIQIIMMVIKQSKTLVSD